MVKTCKKCNQELDSELFWKNKKNKDGVDIYCIECRKSYQNEWIIENPEKLKQKRKNYYLKNKEILYKKRKEREKSNPQETKRKKAIYAKRFFLKNNYGLTEKDYENMHLDQQGKCAICGLKSEKVLCVDHDHKTGKIRKLLCNSCNIKLGYYEQDNNFHLKAKEYLEALT